MSKTTGYTDQAIGTVKENVGHAIGNEQMEAEGKLQNTKGKAEVEGVKAANRVEGTVDQVKGAVKEKVGKVTGSDDRELEGKLQKEAGKAKKAVNQ